MTNQHVLVIGGSSGMGLALAGALLETGRRVTIAGRSTARLAAATAQLAASPGAPLRAVPLDVGVEDQVAALAGDGFDHVVVTAADAVGAYAPLPDFTLDAARTVLATKVLGPWLVAKHLGTALPPGGSLTFTSGIAAYRPGPGSSMIATANGALEALARTLALELAPARVNVVSPGWVDTPIWDTLAGAAKPDRLAAMASRLPVGRVGTPADVAQAFLAVLDNGFMTGTVVHVDGGHRLV
ncbi:SDR family oxidoreductase [Dactylosporangium aurantiacum]|uniref:SDR family oxidoreductase n=1 Tax=Dactylosporangium aurantiacum TaxID=35754 RepID=A0A9Q9MJZ7_9ACTN|nr:SDR family oxidoreductase [Dactylosporangium aurantiacum]MDG6107792.1 SDR family oxidoreductase [Dactylosporangium aurantiacum]UWZ57430.1 SDR family oxidoreductase [Dactylosporangium aurantiacum]